MSDVRKTRSLRLYILLVVGTIFAVFILLSFFLVNSAIPTLLRHTEDTYLSRELDTASNLFQEAARRIYLSAARNSLQSETIALATGKSIHGVNLQSFAFSLAAASQVDFLIIKNARNQDMFADYRGTEGGYATTMPPEFAEHLVGLTTAILTQDKPQGRQNFIYLGSTAYAVTAFPVMDYSDGRPLRVGVLIMGNILNNNYFRMITHMEHIKFETMLPQLSSGMDTASPFSRGDTMSAVLSLEDADGNPLVLHFSERRPSYGHERAVLERLTGALFACILLFSVLLYVTLTRLLLRPVETLSAEVVNINAGQQIDVRNYRQISELYNLTAAINAMMTRMNQSQISLDGLRSILNRIDAYIYVNDPETGTFYFANDKMKRDYPLSSGGYTCWEVLRPDSHLHCPVCPMKYLQDSEDEVFIWDEYDEETGHTFHRTHALIEWGNGKPGHLQYFVDITESKRAAEELQKAKELAEQSNLAKSEFLSRMSHEMRTPMNAVIGMTAIAKASTDPERKEECLGKIENASIHLLGVINDILDMSKIEANKFDLSPTEFDFEKMLLRVINVINFKVDEKEQDLLVKLDSNLPPFIVTDEQRLAQVITNLLSNAVKFTPEHGTITLEAELEHEDDAKCTMLIKVVDTGIGIDHEQKSKLFRSFEQADGSISRRFGGTGLGLAISKRIVELMNGTIWVESEPGHGSSFIFRIEVQRGEKTREKTIPANVDWTSIRILAVDDAPEVRDYFLTLAETIGFQCDVASSGAEAYEFITNPQGKGYDLIFADWRMPVMNGLELAHRIKDNVEDKPIVIMISAAEWSEMENEAHQAGIDGYLQKPMLPSLIMDSIVANLGYTVRPADSSITKANLHDDFSGKHMLLAEDIEINREIVIALLENTHIAIDCAENGIEAIKMFKQNPSLYDIIFMDIHMPEMDGYEATRQIRALDIPEATTIPIVAMTANVFREDIEQCLACGMNGHVGKPINTDELLAIMRTHLGSETS